MFDKIQLVRKSILLAYCLLLSVFVSCFVNLLSFTDGNEINKINDLQIFENNVCEPKSNIFQSFFLKCLLAFLAGGLVSDKVFLKAGVF